MPIYGSFSNALSDATQDILDQHDIDIDALQAAIDLANGRIDTNQTTINTNATIAQQLQQDLSELEAVVINNATDIEAINVAVANIQNTLSQFNTDVSELQADVAANTTAIADNDIAIAENTSAISNLQSAVNSNASDISALNTSVSTIDARVTANELAIDNIEVAILDGANDVSALKNIANVLETTVYEDNANVYADGARGVEDAQLRDGWYYTNDSVGPNNKINWYFFAYTQATVTLGDFSGYAVVTFDDNVELPFFGVYTVPTGVNDAAAWYHSRKVFSVAGATPVVGQKYVVYFGQEPDVYPALPRLELTVDTISTVGELNDFEIVLTSSYSTNSNAAVGDVKLLTEALGVNSLGFKSEVNLEIHRASQVDFDALSGSVSTNTSAISNLNQDLSELTARVVNNETDILTNAGAISTNSSNIATNTAAISTLSDAYNIATADITANANAISALDSRVTTNEQDIASNLSSINSLSSIVGGYASDIQQNAFDIQSLDTRVGTLETDLTSLQGAYSNITLDLSNVQDQANANSTQIGLNQTAINTNATNIDTLTSRMDSVESGSTQLQIDVANNTSAINQNTSDIAIIDGRIDAILSGTTTDFDTFVEVVTAFQNADSNLNGAITQLASDSATADANLQSQITANTDAINIINGDAIELSNQVDANTQAIQSNDADILALQTSVSNNTTSIATNASDISNLDTRLTTAEGNIASNDADIAALQNSVATNSSSITALDGRVTTAEAGIAQNSSDISVNTANIAQNTADIAAITQYSDALVDAYLKSGDVTSINFENATSLSWNAAEGTLEFPVNPNVTLQIGQEQHVFARNLSGGTITNGTVVRVTGASGAKITVDVADNTLEGVSSSTIGVATEDINNNATGYVTTNGLVGGIDTSAFADGDAVYLGTNGALTNVKPVTPAHLVLIGWVVRSSITEGSIFVAVRNGWEIEELHNVDINAVAANDLLRYNGTYWENWTPDYATISYVDAADAVLQGQITTNASAISGLDTRLTTAESDITANSAAISGNTADIVQIQTDLAAIDVSGLQTQVDANTASITSLDSRVTTLETSPSGSGFETGMVVQKNTAPLNGAWLPLDGMTYNSALYPALSGTPGYPETSAGFTLDSIVKSDIGNSTYGEYNWVLSDDETVIAALEKTNNDIIYSLDGGATFNILGVAATFMAPYGAAEPSKFICFVAQQINVFDPIAGTLTPTGFSAPVNPLDDTNDPIYGIKSIATDGEGIYVNLTADDTTDNLQYNTTPYDHSTWVYTSTQILYGETASLNAVIYDGNKFWLAHDNGQLWTTSDFVTFTNRTPVATIANPMVSSNGILVVASNMDASGLYHIYDVLTETWTLVDQSVGDGVSGIASAWIHVEGSSSLWIRRGSSTTPSIAYTGDNFATLSSYDNTVDNAFMFYSAVISGTTVYTSSLVNNIGDLVTMSFTAAGSTFDVPNVASTIPGYTYYVKAD